MSPPASLLIPSSTPLVLPLFSLTLNLLSSSFSAPLDIPSDYKLIIWSPKCKISFLNISGPSSISKQMRQSNDKPSKGNKQADDLSEAFCNLADMIRTFSSTSVLLVSAPPSPSTASGTIAVGQFLKCLEESRQHGDVWLLDSKATQMLELFENDVSTSTFYMAVAKKNNEAILHQWVWQRLDAHRDPISWFVYTVPTWLISCIPFVYNSQMQSNIIIWLGVSTISTIHCMLHNP